VGLSGNYKNEFCSIGISLNIKKIFISCDKNVKHLIFDIEELLSFSIREYFVMFEYFCSGHDDRAIDVISYDCNGNEIERKTFYFISYEKDLLCWKAADEYAQELIKNGRVLKTRIPF
jgi:hypothetical protein